MRRRILAVALLSLYAVACDASSADVEPGPTGPAGQEGEPGADGPTGPTGPEGARGDTGSQGPVGPQGPAGPAGPNGLPIVWLGSFASAPAGATNQAYHNTNDGAAYIHDGTNWGLMADGGIAGPQGPAGAVGPAGPTGSTGSPGAQGDIGPVGPAGETGPPGPNGATGPTGPAGSPGSPGAQGPQGAAGPAGPAGGDNWGEQEAVFAGFSTATPDGNAGGREAMHAICAAEFGAAHMCHIAEYNLSNSATPVPASGSWLDASAATSDTSFSVLLNLASKSSGRYTGYAASTNCLNWTNNSSGNEGVTLHTWGASSSYVDDTACDVARPVACCATPFRESFAGITTATYTGNMGGRANAHFYCASEFPGSHLCHAAEYTRSHSTVTPPTSGMWIDTSELATGNHTVTYNTGIDNAGRYTGYAASTNCLNWTNDSSGNEGTTVHTWGMSNSYVDDTACDVARPLACCQ